MKLPKNFNLKEKQFTSLNPELVIKDEKSSTAELEFGKQESNENQQSQSIPSLLPTKQSESSHSNKKLVSIQKLRKRREVASKSSIDNKYSAHSIVNQVTKYSYATKKGISMKKNIPPKSKENQDSYISAARFNNLMHTHFFGVCDGHGVNGKFVSNYVKKKLPQFLKEEFMKTNLLFSTEIGKYPPSNQMNDSIVASFFKTNENLIKQDFDVRFSGSTWTSVFIIGK